MIITHEQQEPGNPTRPSRGTYGAFVAERAADSQRGFLEASAERELNGAGTSRIIDNSFEDAVFWRIGVFTTNCVGPLATILREPRQARKGATVA